MTFCLKNICWDEQTDYIEKTSTDVYIDKNTEIISGNVYVRLQNSKASAHTVPVRCWWCKMRIVSIKHLETRYIPSLDTFTDEGAFCCKNCAKAYAIEMFPTDRALYGKAISMLEFENRKQGATEPITPSPDWRLLKEFGGVYSSIQYKKLIGNYMYVSNPSKKFKGHIPTTLYFQEIKK